MPRHASALLCGATALVAVFLAFLMPSPVPYEWLVEGGVIEDATVVLYLVAILVVLAAPSAGLSWVDKIAISLVLAAFAAREMDLHQAMYGTSILKARFYNRDGTPMQIVGALAVLLPIFVSIGYLVKRYARRWLPALRQGHPAAISFLLFVLALVISKTCDRAPDVLNQAGMPLPQLWQYVLQSIEECLEMTLPLIVALIAWQAGECPRQPEGLIPA